MYMFDKIDYSLFNKLFMDHSQAMQSLDIPQSYKDKSPHIALEIADCDNDLRTFKILLSAFPFLRKHVERTRQVWHWNFKDI